MELRFVEREIHTPAPEMGEGIERVEIKRILQYRNYNEQGGGKWRDVPCVKEDQTNDQ